MDEKEKIRGWINFQLGMLKRTATVINMFLLVFANSLLLSGYLEQRNIHPYVAIPLVFISVSIILWYLSRFFVLKMEMYRTEKLTDKILDPFAVYGLIPYEEMWFRELFIPNMEARYSMMPEGRAKEEYKKHIDNVKEWVVNGIIPKKQFPEHLKKYYLTEKEHRLEL